MVPQRKVVAVMESPRGYDAGLRPLGYYATKNCALVAQWATHQIKVLLIVLESPTSCRNNTAWCFP